ncbi:TlpA disulfide reductase family protein [Butyricimonas sp. Marseille-P3923]|uniref:TlpA family protein disulfide reductase n=1 Tax=Butyricimonas sp. Marseille-P3923 TaxID=1987504 RepID=UPI000C0833A9|nr:TlpA disulfide reductase family protein [Butyricimonas sp. Marseille-P3923]
MKKIFVLMLVLCCTRMLVAQEFTAIKGKVADRWLSQVKLYETIDGAPVVCAVAKVEPDGSFGFLVKPKKPGFYVLGEDEKMNFPVYVKGGEEINIELRENKATLTGKNTKENVQLYKWQEYDYNIWLKSVFFQKIISTYEDFFPEYEKFVDGLPAFKANVKSGNKVFDALLKEWIDYSADYYGIVFLYTPRTKHPKASDYPAYYNQIVNPEKFADESVLAFPNGTTMLRLYAIFAANQKNVAPSDKAAYEQACLEALPNDRLKGEFVVDRFFSQYRTYEEYLDGMNKFGKYWLSPSLKTRAEAVGTKLYQTRSGGIAADFTYPDVRGKNVSLSDFKGKVVLIDVWATWCGPCKQEIPHLKKLEEEMKGTDVVFLGVSVDEAKNKQKWLDFIESEKLGGIQVFANGWSKITKDYRINGIPRFIVIDRKGNVASFDAPRPSNPALKKMLEMELKK